MTADVQVIGADALAASLTRVSSQLDRLPAGQRVATAGAQTARRGAPVRTGRLRGSITAQTSNPLEVRLVASAPYAAYVEFGTRYMTGRRFMRSAYEQMTGELEDQTFHAVDALLAGVKGA